MFRGRQASALLVELLEELQILQAGRVHVGADHVQADVEGVAHNKNHEEDGNPHRRGRPPPGMAPRMLNTCPITEPASIMTIRRE